MEAVERDPREPLTVKVQSLTMELLTCSNNRALKGLTRAYNEGAGAKWCCLCCPLSEDPDGQGVLKYMEENPSRLPTWGVAIEEGSEELLGFVATTIHPEQPMVGLHTTEPGEAYIDELMVCASARGRGVGTKLLEWAEALARDRKCTCLSLEVLNGNPAVRLYERFGLQVKPAGLCYRLCFDPLFICCYASLHYGCSHWGSLLMTKPLK